MHHALHVLDAPDKDMISNDPSWKPVLTTPIKDQTFRISSVPIILEERSALLWKIRIPAPDGCWLESEATTSPNPKDGQ